MFQRIKAFGVSLKEYVTQPMYESHFFYLISETELYMTLTFVNFIKSHILCIFKTSDKYYIHVWTNAFMLMFG